MKGDQRNHIKHILAALLVTAALAGIACGTSARPANTTAPRSEYPATPVATQSAAPVEAPGVASIPTPAPAVAPTLVPDARSAPRTAKVTRLVFATTPAGIETNRIWIGGPAGTIPSAFVETLIGLDPKSGAFIPLLADKWEFSPDGKSWTFFLHRGVPFHFDFGGFTARDVVHTHSLLTREDSIAAHAGFWRGAEKLEAVSDYQVVFRMKDPATSMPYVTTRTLVVQSKAQWDREGVEGIDRSPAGAGSYQYVERRLGQGILFERVDNHWRGERPDFKELEIRWVPDVATRLAMLLTGEAHMADLPRAVQDQAVKDGMKVIASQLSQVNLIVHFGGQYHVKGDPDFKPEVPWHDRRVRQAMNLAINRKEILGVIFKDRGTPAQVIGYHPVAHRQEGWNPAWEQRFDELYGYNPAKAKALLDQAGYAPGAIKVKGTVFRVVAVPELPEVMEAIQVYLHKVGIQMALEEIDVARAVELRRKKQFHCCFAPGVPDIRPIEEHLRLWNTRNGNIHSFEDDFIEEKFLALNKAMDPQERNRLAREIGDHLFENFSGIPLYWLFLEVLVNPKVVAEWTFPGGAFGRWSHWALLKAAN